MYTYISQVVRLLFTPRVIQDVYVKRNESLIVSHLTERRYNNYVYEKNYQVTFYVILIDYLGREYYLSCVNKILLNLKGRAQLERRNFKIKFFRPIREHTTVVCTFRNTWKQANLQAFSTQVKMSHTMFNDELNYVRWAEMK